MTQPPAYLQDLAVGQLVFHWKFGHGQVLTTRRVDGQEHAQIDFGRRGLVTLMVDGARLTDPNAPEADRRRDPWEDLLDESTPLRPMGLEPWQAWFGAAAVSDEAAFRDLLNEIGAHNRPYPVGRYGATELGWPEVSLFLHDERVASRSGSVHSGVVLAHAPAGARPLFVGWPFYSDWAHAHCVTPRSFRVCEARVEAMVQADLHLRDWRSQAAELRRPAPAGHEDSGRASAQSATLAIAFALPTFDLGRMHLRRDAKVEVTLTALAFECAPSPSQTLRVRHDSAMIDALRAQGIELPSDPDGLTPYSTQGMNVWMPGADRPDLVEFRGLVVAAQRITLPPRQRSGWKLQIRAWQDGPAEWLLDVVFEASVWAVESEPTVGNEVAGRAWLVGEVLGRVPVVKRGS